MGVIIRGRGGVVGNGREGTKLAIFARSENQAVCCQFATDEKSQ